MRRISEFFKALGDETRVRMLWLLMNHDELCVCDFMEVLEITQSKASRHLRNLYHAGLVTDRREGLWNYYSLKPVHEYQFGAHLDSLRRNLAAREDSGRMLRALRNWMKVKARSQKCLESVEEGL